METSIKFGIRLLNVLHQKGLTLEQLSQKSSIAISRLYGLAKGTSEVTLSELYFITNALDVPPYWLLLHTDNFFDSWNVTLEELEDVISNNPSLRGFINGYMAELKVRNFFKNDSRISKLFKYDDHDRTKKAT